MWLGAEGATILWWVGSIIREEVTSVNIDYYRRVVGGWEEHFTSATTPIYNRRGLLSISAAVRGRVHSWLTLLFEKRSSWHSSKRWTVQCSDQHQKQLQSSFVHTANWRNNHIDNTCFLNYEIFLYALHWDPMSLQDYAFLFNLKEQWQSKLLYQKRHRISPTQLIYVCIITLTIIIDYLSEQR